MKHWFGGLINIPLLLALRSATWHHWRSTLMWVAYNILGSLMPIWGTYFLLHLYHQSFILNDFAKHGEFALYTAAFLAPALQQVVQSIRHQRYVLGTGAVLISVTGLVVSAIIYSGLTTGSTLMLRPANSSNLLAPTSLNESFLLASTLVLFALSLMFAFAVMLIEKVVFEPSLANMESASEKKLQHEFAAALPESATGLIERTPATPPTADHEEMQLAQVFKEPSAPGASQ